MHRYKLKLDDGGCLYTLSDQPGSVVQRNWCSGQPNLPLTLTLTLPTAH